MYRKDLIVDETQKFTQLIAKLLKLKTDNINEAILFFRESLLKEFNLPANQFEQWTNDDFNNWLKQQNYSPQKLNALAQSIYLQYQPLQHTHNTTLALHKVLTIFSFLEQHRHLQSFENITIQHQIKQHLA